MKSLNMGRSGDKISSLPFNSDEVDDSLMLDDTLVPLNQEQKEFIDKFRQDEHLLKLKESPRPENTRNEG